MDTDGRYQKELHDIIMDAVTAMGKFSALMFGLNLNYQTIHSRRVEHPNIF
jgi:hypothetical protein